MLHFSAGTKRQSSIANLIRRLAKQRKIPVADIQALEYDILQGRRHDSSQKKRQVATRAGIDDGVEDVLNLSPPCNARTRAC